MPEPVGRSYILVDLDGADERVLARFRELSSTSVLTVKNKGRGPFASLLLAIVEDSLANKVASIVPANEARDNILEELYALPGEFLETLEKRLHPYGRPGRPGRPSGAA